VSFIKNDKFIVTAGLDKTIRIDKLSKTQFSKIGTKSNRVNCIVRSRCESIIVIGGDDNHLRFY